MQSVAVRQGATLSFSQDQGRGSELTCRTSVLQYLSNRPTEKIKRVREKAKVRVRAGVVLNGIFIDHT